MKRRPYKTVSPSTMLLMRQIIIGVMIIAFFSMLLISTWYGTRVEALTISKVTIKGGETIPHEQVESIVRDTLGGTYLKFVPRAFSLFYPQETIESKIREIKKIKDLQISQPSQTEILVEFSEYIPHALWCKDTELEKCYFLDETGYSFSAAPQLSGGSFLRFVSIGKEPVEHTQAFSSDDYQKVHELVTRLRETGWNISRVDLDAARDGFFTVVDGGELKISLKQSVDETMENFLTVMGSEKFSHIKPGNFEYVDLRFGSKVFVNEVTEVTTIATSTDEVLSTPSEAPTDGPSPSPEGPIVTIPNEPLEAAQAEEEISVPIEAEADPIGE